MQIKVWVSVGRVNLNYLMILLPHLKPLKHWDFFGGQLSRAHKHMEKFKFFYFPSKCFVSFDKEYFFFCSDTKTITYYIAMTPK